MNPAKAYDYLSRSRVKVLDAVRSLTPKQYERRFAFGLNTIGRTLTHTMVSEWYYVERLLQRQVPPYEQWPIQDEQPPAFAVIDETWRAQAPRTRAAIEAERDWSRRVGWDGFADEQGRRFRVAATAGDLLAQLLFHEVHHRAQVMAMLREIGPPASPVEDIDYNAMMFERTPLVER